MSEDWITRVMRMNTVIVMAEARFNALAISFANFVKDDREAPAAENLLTSYRQTLTLLREMQSDLLGEVKEVE